MAAQPSPSGPASKPAVIDRDKFQPTAYAEALWQVIDHLRGRAKAANVELELEWTLPNAVRAKDGAVVIDTDEGAGNMGSLKLTVHDRMVVE